MPQQIGWSVESKLLYEIKQLTRQLSGRQYILTFPNFASFPTPGITGTLYVDEATGDIYVWNGTAYTILSSGITALNGLIAAAQLLTTGSTGTDFNISSVGTTHTFNIPTASATNRGLLSSANWTTFNNKQNAITLTTTGTSGAATLVGSTLNIPQYQSVLTNPVTGTGTTNYVPKFTALSTIGNSQIFDNGTNVGIGTASPALKLHVEGGMRVRSASGQILEYTNDILYNYGGSGNYWQYINGADYVLANRTATGALTFGTNSTERLRITSGGDVGIGTASPTQKIHVSSASNTAILAQSTTTFPLFVLTNNNGVSWNIEGGRTSNSFGIYQSAGAGGGTTYFNIRENGRVGVNTTTDAGYQFDVNGSFRTTGSTDLAGEVRIGINDQGAYLLQVGGPTYLVSGANTALTTSAGLHYMAKGDNTYFTGFNFQGVAASDMFFGRAASSDDIVISTSNTGSPAERVRFKQNGDVGIGTNAPSYKLDINGTLRSVNGANFATTSGNVGIGVVPSAWSVVTATQIKQGALSADQASNIFNVSNNLFYDGSVNKYIQNGSAAFYQLFQNQHIFYNAPSGTAGGTITFAERMRIDASGNVGIGTASAASKLDVNGDVIALASSFTPLSLRRDISSATAGVVANFQLKNGSNAYVDYAWVNGGIVNSTTGSHEGFLSFHTANAGSVSERGRFNNNGELLINTTTDAGDYKLQVAGNIYNTGSAVLAATSGNVGIGNISPTYKLDINSGTSQGSFRAVSTSTSSNRVFFEATAGSVEQHFLYTGNQDWVLGLDKADGNKFKLSSADDGFASAKLTVTTSGNVGIGTASPSAKLSILDGIATNIGALSGNNTFAGLSFTTSSSAILAANYNLLGNGTDFILNRVTGGNIHFRENNTNQVTILNGGNVGIGTASPAVKFDVTASGGDIAAFRRTDAGNALVQYTNANTTDDIIHRFRLNAGAGNFYDMRYYGTGGYFGLQYNGNNGLHLTTSSEVLINTTTDAGDYKLQVVGNQYISSKLVVGTTTDSGQTVQINSSLRLIPTSTVPTASAGTLYYDTATNKLKLYDGTSWVDLN